MSIDRTKLPKSLNSLDKTVLVFGPLITEICIDHFILTSIVLIFTDGRNTRLICNKFLIIYLSFVMFFLEYITRIATII